MNDTSDTGGEEESSNCETEIISASKLAGENGGVSCSYSSDFSLSYFVILVLAGVYFSLIRLNKRGDING